MTAPESFAGNTQGDPQWEIYMHTADEGLQVRVPVTAGAHEISVSFIRRFWESEGILQPPQRGFARTTNELYHGEPAVDNVAVAGPLAPAKTAAGTAAASEPLFVCRPLDFARDKPLDFARGRHGALMQNWLDSRAWRCGPRDIRVPAAAAPGGRPVEPGRPHAHLLQRQEYAALV
jgi:hypothetical protein